MLCSRAAGMGRTWIERCQQSGAVGNSMGSMGCHAGDAIPARCQTSFHPTIELQYQF